LGVLKQGHIVQQGKIIGGDREGAGLVFFDQGSLFVWSFKESSPRLVATLLRAMHRIDPSKRSKPS
jgi:hypothetical protein